jgi:hypothetical protein
MKSALTLHYPWKFMKTIVDLGNRQNHTATQFTETREKIAAVSKPQFARGKAEL